MEDKYTCQDCKYGQEKECTLAQDAWEIHGAECIEDIVNMERERFTS